MSDAKKEMCILPRKNDRRITKYGETIENDFYREIEISFQEKRKNLEDSLIWINLN